MSQAPCILLSNAIIGMPFGLSFLESGVAGEAYAELVENLMVDLAEHHSRVRLAAVEFRQLLESKAAVLYTSTEYGEGDKHLVGMQARIAACAGIRFWSFESAQSSPEV